MALSALDLFNVPPGAVADVRIIDCTSRIIRLPVSLLMEPPLSGMDYMPDIPTWAFLIESPTGKKALFDLGVPPNFLDFSPVNQEQLRNPAWEIRSEKHVADILRESQIDPASINSIIWSHWHFDHIGDPSTFPGTTELVVGPGFKEKFYPGYPAIGDAPVRESDFAGRTTREIHFDDDPGIKIGHFRALDFFGDGSFYLLDAPGHAVGHLAGLVRTTSNPDTFIFCGGDLCHHGGEIRPSKHIHLPKEIHVELPDQMAPWVCPGSALERLNQNRSRAGDEPFFIPNPSFCFDAEETMKTITKAQEADADENVLFIYAHSKAVEHYADLFPLKANEWKKKGWKSKMLWDFVRDFKPALDAQQALGSP
ncbi:uncharacterized protein Z520_09222 [Fonsecaea multimorphosa CBS 102226]|uniref:Metallo-beta-lactamase domain-containing protein n=1 Tax=Fonsecaea multimorphosa CBS 102226 TaxID=1442371 RepID=A0A0D2JNM9_9EURO|nr:uncharacterized protein Z520_09222 [Fonsecaea multimorphosa CBS 102226]KIX94912.1 hypothetical protein Z520_09222 [Fonsecaea multimorphosa CBS 102226]OAL20564.1 hypothetical protein AYO22_08573 [Fonsecaea multimorphosa]